MSVALLLIPTTPNTQPMGALGIAEGGPGAFPGAPQQLLVPAGFVSYFSAKEDDLGKSKCLHKPLNKGIHAQASLAKSWASSEPSMRPHCWIPAEASPASTLLRTDDIQGARTQPHRAFSRSSRCCNPLSPQYHLASSPPPPPPQPPPPQSDAYAQASQGMAAASPTVPTVAGLLAGGAPGAAAGCRGLQGPAPGLQGIEHSSPTPMKCWQPQVGSWEEAVLTSMRK
ncbi:hypothetical protein V8C86DRAFT_2482099 [Haematococcus lacustris]